MIVFHNHGPYRYEMITSVDTSIEGCRLAPNQTTVTQFEPDDDICHTRVEPGFMFTFRLIDD